MIDVNGTLYDATRRDGAHRDAGRQRHRARGRAYRARFPSPSRRITRRRRPMWSASPRRRLLRLVEPRSTSYPDTTLPQPNSVVVPRRLLPLHHGRRAHLRLRRQRHLRERRGPRRKTRSPSPRPINRAGSCAARSGPSNSSPGARRACTVYTNAGTSPFPLSRTTIIPVGPRARSPRSRASSRAGACSNSSSRPTIRCGASMATRQPRSRTRMSSARSRA